MKIFAAIPGHALTLAIAFSIGVAMVPADASAMSKKDRRTLVGAVVGGIGGSVLSKGDPWATVGGALAGGTVGNITTKDRDRDRRWDDNRRNERWDRRGDRRNDRRWERDHDRRRRGH